MMTLDEKILDEARQARQKLVDLESQTAHARVDYHHAIKRLHAAGGSLREIAEVLELSHQRVHQIVEDVPLMAWPRHRMGHGRTRHGRLGMFLAGVDDEAKAAVLEAHEEAEALKHSYVGTEHLLLALLRRRTEALGISPDVARDEIVKRVGEGEESGRPRRRPRFNPRAKRTLENAFREATAAGRRRIASEDLLLAIASDPKGTGAEVLQALGVTPERLREQLGR
jgi:hypothetical protein